jgi:signal transduction histidine kinase
MKSKSLACTVFLAIAALVIGGLGWVTYAVLEVEARSWHSDFEHELNAQVSLALWRLDSRVSPALAREDSRPFNHYSAFYAPAVVFNNRGQRLTAGDVLEPSPLLNAELPNWMVLHFQTDATAVGWDSPQVLSQKLNRILDKAQVPLDNVTPSRDRLRLDLAGSCSPSIMATWVQQHSQPTSTEMALLPATNPGLANPGQVQQADQQQQYAIQPQGQGQEVANSANNFSQRPQINYKNNDVNEVQSRTSQIGKVKQENQNKPETYDLSLAMGNIMRNGEGLLANNPSKSPRSEKVVVSMGAMAPVWLPTSNSDDSQSAARHLAIARLVKIGDREVCQGVLLDWPKLQVVLADEVKDLFPEATFEPDLDPQPAAPTMKWLPVRFNPGPVEAPPVPTWTPLRIGLASAWAAALVALVAVGLGGWSLISLSERRVRFVSAVTHELRTPLTTLRLYLDMMTGGLVNEPQQQAEYLQTLHGETERLNRLVANVLDFSRLERQRPRLEKTTVPVAELLEQVRGNWEERCKSADKELIAKNALPEGTQVTIDVKLVEQVLGNLVDNACKYSRGAADRRIWLRAGREDKRLVFEVEDRGPGVAPRERRSIFRPFRRGKGVDATAGGVGLGLALARQWASLLGGSLSVLPGDNGTGARFRLELPT